MRSAGLGRVPGRALRDWGAVARLASALATSVPGKYFGRSPMFLSHLGRIIAAMNTQVILTGALLALALILFARALMSAWPVLVAEVPKGPCGFMPSA